MTVKYYNSRINCHLFNEKISDGVMIIRPHTILKNPKTRNVPLIHRIGVWLSSSLHVRFFHWKGGNLSCCCDIELLWERVTFFFTISTHLCFNFKIYFISLECPVCLWTYYTVYCLDNKYTLCLSSLSLACLFSLINIFIKILFCSSCLFHIFQFLSILNF